MKNIDSDLLFLIATIFIAGWVIVKAIESGFQRLIEAVHKLHQAIAIHAAERQNETADALEKIQVWVGEVEDAVQKLDPEYFERQHRKIKETALG